MYVCMYVYVCGMYVYIRGMYVYVCGMYVYVRGMYAVSAFPTLCLFCQKSVLQNRLFSETNGCNYSKDVEQSQALPCHTML